MLFGNTGNNVEAFPLSPGETFTPLGVPPPNGFTQGLAYADNKVYACGTDGSLYVLDLSLPLATGPGFQPLSLPINGGTLAAGPLAAPAAGGTRIAFSVNAGITNSVCFYDPATGNLLQLDTNHMLATQLVVDENGILYAAGEDPDDDPGNPNTPFGQVYAIRLDTLLQGERDFIVESELMQDFEAPVPGQLAATARYQTHVTVVDAQKAPRPFQPIKVWADAPILSLIEIDGVPYYIDATTPVTVQTDATGILTIVTDADLSTTALAIWAGFMDPYERIVVYPDRTFHNRLGTTHYDAASPSPDPTKINLATASTYTVTNLSAPPPPLYTTPAQQGGAQAVAPVIQQFAQIPVLSELWQALTGAPLTVLYGLFSAISDAVAISGGELTVLAVLYGVVTSLGVAFDLVVGDVLTPAVWVVVASILDLVLLLLNAIPTLPVGDPLDHRRGALPAAARRLLAGVRREPRCPEPRRQCHRRAAHGRQPDQIRPAHHRCAARRAGRRPGLRPRRRGADPGRHDQELGHRRQPDRPA